MVRNSHSWWTCIVEALSHDSWLHFQTRARSFVLSRASIWCVVAPQKRRQCLSGNHSSSVKRVLNVRVSLISRALPSLTSDNRGHFISARLGIQPTRNLLSPDSQFWASDHVYFVWDFRSLAISPLRKILLLRRWMKKIWFSLCPENSELWFQVTWTFSF